MTRKYIVLPFDQMTIETDRLKLVESIFFCVEIKLLSSDTTMNCCYISVSVLTIDA